MKISAKQYATGFFESLLEKKGKEGEVIKNFAKLLFTDNQLSKLEEIIENFERLWNEHNNIVEGEIITASKIDKSLVDKLKALISQKTGGKKAEVKEIIDKNILGGVILRYGDRTLDLSLRTKLNELKEKLGN